VCPNDKCIPFCVLHLHIEHADEGKGASQPSPAICSSFWLHMNVALQGYSYRRNTQKQYGQKQVLPDLVEHCSLHQSLKVIVSASFPFLPPQPFKHADFVIEAVVEDEDAKMSVFKRLDQVFIKHANQG